MLKSEILDKLALSTMSKMKLIENYVFEYPQIHKHMILSFYKRYFMEKFFVF